MPEELNSKQNELEKSEAQDLEKVQPTEEKKKLAVAEQELAKVKDLLLRKAAEFENYKKRVEQESATIVKFANEDLITEVLPVIDDLERFLKSGKEDSSVEVLYRGIELIYQKLVKILESQGLKTFDTVGKEFDVGYHDALMQMERPDVPPHTVLEEVQKGYTLNGRVIRHAKVIVSSSPTAADQSPRAKEQPPGDNHQDTGKR